MRYLILFSVMISLAGCGEKQVGQAPLFTNLGTLDFPITTNSELAQNILTRE